MKTPETIESQAKKCADALTEGANGVQEYLSKLSRTEKAIGDDEEKKRKVAEARDVVESWQARYHAAKAIIECKAFAVYTVDNDLLIVQPHPQSATLIAKAEELGARITKLGEFGKNG